MAQRLAHTIQTVRIAIINRDGSGVQFVEPASLVLFLLWFLGSSTAKAIAITATVIVYRVAIYLRGWRDDLSIILYALWTLPEYIRWEVSRYV